MPYSQHEISRFFHNFFFFGGGGLALILGMIFGPHREQSQMGGTRVGDGVRWEGTWKYCLLRPKMPSYSKIGATFGVLSIK